MSCLHVKLLTFGCLSTLRCSEQPSAVSISVIARVRSYFHRIEPDYA
jgi:hypothetical protein